MSLLDVILLFSVMSLLALVPSASVALVVTRSSTAGFPHGAAVAAGIVLGDLVFVCLAVLGLAVMAEAMGGFFVVVKYLAGAYLIWFGLSLLRAKRPTLAGTRDRSTSSLTVSFFSGLILTLGDIKAIFFYASLFPAFVDLSSISATDLASIVVITLLAVGGVKVGYAYAGVRVASLAGGRGAGRGAKVAAGGLMIGVGAYLVAKA
ncbi:LysE family translocator [Thioalkalivibrio sulfidiphilus]|nr:LysE family translocator [Thioalkalivibrio sulfidiphilus]